VPSCRHLTWKPHHACSLGTQVFYILDYRMLIRPVQFSILIHRIINVDDIDISSLVSGLFVPLHIRCREQKVHRENFCSRGTFVPWNIRSWVAKSPRTFVPWNFRTPGTFAPQERMFQELSFHGTFAPVEPSLHKQLFVPFNFRSCGTFAPVLKKVVESRKAMFS